jgi:L,D-transpeptidase YcbB
MKLILPFIFSVLLYISCGNVIDNKVLAQKKTDDAAQEIKKINPGDWNSSENRKQLIEAIKNSKDEGLLPEDYFYDSIVSYEKAYETLDEKGIETYQNLLTKSFCKYINHLSNGKLNPNELYLDWDVKRNIIDSDSVLKITLENHDISKTLEDSKPKHNIYKYLKKSLTIINSYPQDDMKPIYYSNKLNIGSKNTSIILIKKRLQYWKDLGQMDTITDVYDVDMQDAIKKFQARHGLEADGVIGKGTITALNVTQEQRRQQIIVNLERWRWFPRDLGINHLVVNIPNYYLHAVQSTDTTKMYRVVVGSEKRKTPILSSQIDNIVFNPTWTVPPTILEEDLIPGTQLSTTYLTKRRIVIYNRKGKEVSPEDWSFASAKDYKYVQSPGVNNSLGYVKINFPSKHAVYLHDTNHRDLFVKNYRALSSGCVRVENPLKLAEYLLYSKGNYTTAKIDSILFQKKTTIVKMDEEFNVHILYFTAWYEKGQLEFRNDVYSYDPELYLRLCNKLRANLITTRVVDK